MNRVRLYLLDELESTRDETVMRELRDQVEDIEYLLGEMEYVSDSYESLLNAYDMAETNEERSTLDRSLNILNEHERDIHGRVCEYLID